MGTSPGHKPNPIVRAKLFELLKDETIRTVIRRTNESARTQQWLIQNIKPNGKTKIGDVLDWFLVFGVLDGNPKDGYRLAVGELIDIFDLVQRSPMRHALWDTLAEPVGRAVLAALLHGQRTGTTLNKVGPRKKVGHELGVLYGGQVVQRERVGNATWWTLLEPTRYTRILGGIDLIISNLGNQMATVGVDAVGRIAYPADHIDDYEPTARAARQPPERVPRPLSEAGANSTVNQRAAAQIWLDLADPGLADKKIIAEFKRSLTRLPRRPYPWADITPQGTNYVDIPGVAAGLLQSLPPMPSGGTERLVYAMGMSSGTRNAHPPPSPGQIRGLRRHAIRVDALPHSPADLDLPRITWVGMDPTGYGFAAEFDADTNELAINFGWPGLINLLEEDWIEQPKSIQGWIERTLQLQHALKLVHCIIVHENEIADRVPNAELPQITEHVLRTAAHWTAVERQELRRRVNQHRSAYLPNRGATT